MATKINNIDGKILVNEGKPLKSILKSAGLVGKMGSFTLPNDVGSVSMVPIMPPIVSEPIPAERDVVSSIGPNSDIPIK